MSRPPVNPDKTLAGIAVDPITLQRVIPESKRPDGSVRKEIKIRPGFTPQEDVKRFKTSRVVQKEANQLPKGHIIGWVPPSSASPSVTKPLSKSQKKNAKRKEKKKEETTDKAAVPDNWEDDDDDDEPEPKEKARASETGTQDGVSSLSEKLGQLDVK